MTRGVIPFLSKTLVVRSWNSGMTACSSRISLSVTATPEEDGWLHPLAGSILQIKSCSRGRCQSPRLSRLCLWADPSLAVDRGVRLVTCRIAFHRRVRSVGRYHSRWPDDQAVHGRGAREGPGLQSILLPIACGGLLQTHQGRSIRQNFPRLPGSKVTR